MAIEQAVTTALGIDVSMPLLRPEEMQAVDLNLDLKAVTYIKAGDDEVRRKVRTKKKTILY